MVRENENVINYNHWKIINVIYFVFTSYKKWVHYTTHILIMFLVNDWEVQSAKLKIATALIASQEFIKKSH